jgi:tRNA modification GTPase
VLDSTQQVSAEDQELLRAAQGRHTIAVANKADLAPNAAFSLRDASPEGAALDQKALDQSSLDGIRVFSTSALTGQGISDLRQEILDQLAGHTGAEQETGFLTNVRHQRLVEEAITSLEAALQAVQRKIPHEMIMLDLYGALRPLDAITGETTTDDILNLIFSSFCIGK